MNFPFFIARRYLFSKKSTNAINVISAVSVAGVAVATMSLVVVLSVFNGFHDLVASLLTNFDPPLKIVPSEGKSMAADDSVIIQIKHMDEVAIAAEQVEDMALAVYNNRQMVVTVIGVDDHYAQLTNIEAILYPPGGQYELHAGILEYGIPGIGMAYTLGLGTRWNGFLSLYAPARKGQLDMTAADEAFTVDSLFSPGVVFMVSQTKYDRSHLITSINFARRLFDMQGELTALDVSLKPGVNVNRVKQRMNAMGNGRIKVLDRYEQQADTFHIMNVEKFIAYIFLTFILMVACFNIIGSLSMLIIEKKDDVKTLRNIGAADRDITRIFLFEGRMISVLGAMVGIALGLLLCALQQQFGLVRLGQSSGMFIVDAYPVSVHAGDVIMTFVTVVAVAWVAAWYPVRHLSRRLFKQ